MPAPALPTPPDLAWNSDWTTLIGNDMLSGDNPCAFNMFASAVRERCYAAAAFAGGFGYDSPPVVPDGSSGVTAGGITCRYPLQPASVFESNQSFPRLQALTSMLAAWFVANDPEGSRIINAYALAYDPAYTIPSPTGQESDHYKPQVFPPTTGWYRCFPREIWKIAYPGTIGQRSRFTARDGSHPWYGALTSDTHFGETSITDDGEKKWSGKYFDYVAHTDGAGKANTGGSPGWAFSTDQRGSVDYVSENLHDYQAGGGEGYTDTGSPVVSFCWPGDAIDGNWLNRLRDALNLLTKTYGGMQIPGTGSPTIGAYGLHSATPLTFFSGILGGSGYGKSGRSSVSTADCVVNYNAATPIPPGTINAIATHSPGDWLLVRSSSSVTNTTDAPNTPTPINRTPKYWIWATADSGGFDFFRDFGDGVLNDEWHEIGGSSSTADTAASSLVSDVFPAATTAPTLPSGNESDGYEYDSLAIILDWAVSGGFAYTSST